MLKVDNIMKDWKEAGSFAAQINLYGFWDEHAFLTKSGDLGAVLKIGGLDYENLDHAGRDYTVKRLEAALRWLDDKTRLYQILFKRNRPEISHGEYDDPLVRAAVEQRAAFLQSKSDRLYSIEIFWVVMIDGSYQKAGLLHALGQLPKQPRSSLRDLRALFLSSKERTLLYEQIERGRLRLQQKVQSLSGQLNDLATVELPGAEETFRILRRLVNFRPSKIHSAPLCDARRLDWQICGSELEAHRGYLRLDDDYVRVFTLKELPGETRPLLLRGLFDIPANFHVVTEWHPVDNAKARKEIAKRRRHYHNSKTSFLSNLQDRQNTGPRDELVPTRAFLSPAQASLRAFLQPRPSELVPRLPWALSISSNTCALVRAMRRRSSPSPSAISKRCVKDSVSMLRSNTRQSMQHGRSAAPAQRRYASGLCAEVRRQSFRP